MEPPYDSISFHLSHLWFMDGYQLRHSESGEKKKNMKRCNDKHAPEPYFVIFVIYSRAEYSSNFPPFLRRNTLIKHMFQVDILLGKKNHTQRHARNTGKELCNFPAKLPVGSIKDSIEIVTSLTRLLFFFLSSLITFNIYPSNTHKKNDPTLDSCEKILYKKQWRMKLNLCLCLLSCTPKFCCCCRCL